MGRFVASGTSAANTAVNVDQAAPGAGRRLIVETLTVTFSGAAPTVGTLVTLESPAGTVRDRFRTEGLRTFRMDSLGIECDPNQLARVAVAAGGTSVVAEVIFRGRDVGTHEG